MKLLLGLLLAAAGPARAITPEAEQVIEQGMRAFYESDFDAAEKIFKDAQAKHPGDPLYSMGSAAAAWWRMENSFVLPGSPEEVPFHEALKPALEDAKRAIHDGEKAEAYLCMGAAYGLKGRWEAAQHHWFAAYFDGLRAHHDAKHALKLDPELYDAYLGIGAFDYYVATLSRFVRAVAFAGSGNKSKGLSELRLAAEKGHLTRVAAKLMLVGIDWTFEKDPKAAWAILEDLHKDYPKGPFMDSMRLIGLFHLRDVPALQKEAKEFLAKAESGAPLFRPIDKVKGHFFVGLGYQLAGDYAQAIANYRGALEDVSGRNRWRSLLRLFIGECLDLSGKRDEAVASYKESLAEPPFWGAPRLAKHLIKKPFREQDNPLPSQAADLD